VAAPAATAIEPRKRLRRILKWYPRFAPLWDGRAGVLGWPVARIAPALVFVLAFAFMFWLVGHRLILSNNDEGIYLDAGHRVAVGQAPYRDFFYLSGPGTPWAMGVSMKLFGVNLAAARLMLMFDISLMAALVFWMTRRLAAPGTAGLVATILFLGFTIAQPAVLLPNHRWDSGAMALAAIVLVLLSREQPRWWLASLAGLACAASVWMTPSLGLLALTLTAWHWFDRQLRPRALAFLAGGFAGLLAGVAVLQSQGALSAMVDQLLWISRNYSGANRMLYGQVIGGYGALTKGAAGIELMILAALILFFTIPAWLPVLATAGWAAHLRRRWPTAGPLRFQVSFLSICGAVLIIAQAPRMDVPHLMFASPIYYALGVALAARARRGPALAAAAVVFLLASGTYANYACLTRMQEQTVRTRAGTASMDPEEAHWLAALASHVQPGDSLFVFPYRPVLYFALNGRNPSRYSFLQPGMSSARDEANVLADLSRDPPQWVIYLNVKPEDYLRVWPSSDRSRLRMESIERFIAEGYSPATQAGQYSLLRRR
jgi:4-amino-4-deoxy-L-arabinose transferase-like glycosyltransferase